MIEKNRTDLSTEEAAQLLSALPWDSLPHGNYLLEEEAGTLKACLIYQQVLDEAEIIYIYTDQAYRRRGYAQTLLSALLAKPSLSQYFLEVRASNLPAQALYAKLGFKPSGVRRKYYNKPIEDAVLMKKEKGGSDGP